MSDDRGLRGLWTPRVGLEDRPSSSRFHLEVAAWAAVAIVAWGLSARFSIFDTIVAFSHAHERWQIDDALSIVMIVGITAFVASLLQSRQQSRRRRAAEREAYLASRRDVLTRLPNRRMFTELAGRALGEAWRAGGDCAVLFIDLDGFKPVNDRYGHAVGDQLLMAVADVLRDEAPQPALPARLGGDEFAVLLPHIRDEAEAIATAQRILRHIQTPQQIGGRPILVNATVGIAIGPANGRRAEDLIHAADVAMYEAKRQGKGAVRVFARPARPADLGSAAAAPRLAQAS